MSVLSGTSRCDDDVWLTGISCYFLWIHFCTCAWWWVGDHLQGNHQNMSRRKAWASIICPLVNLEVARVISGCSHFRSVWWLIPANLIVWLYYFNTNKKGRHFPLSLAIVATETIRIACGLIHILICAFLGDKTSSVAGTLDSNGISGDDELKKEMYGKS